MGIGPVRTFSAIPPTASRRAPPVHEATGGYAVRCPSVYDMKKSKYRDSSHLLHTTKHPVIEDDRVSYKKVAATYSPTWWGSTIGDGELNFSVRNGKRWILTAITATVYVLRKDTDIDSDRCNSDRFHRLSLSTLLACPP